MKNRPARDTINPPPVISCQKPANHKGVSKRGLPKAAQARSIPRLPAANSRAQQEHSQSTTDRETAGRFAARGGGLGRSAGRGAGCHRGDGEGNRERAIGDAQMECRTGAGLMAVGRPWRFEEKWRADPAAGPGRPSEPPPCPKGQAMERDCRRIVARPTVTQGKALQSSLTETCLACHVSDRSSPPRMEDFLDLPAREWVSNP